jgi:predicted lipoprotein
VISPRRCVAAILCALLLACDRNGDRSLKQAILEDLAYGVVLPDLRELADTTRRLREAAERFRASPTDEALEAVRAAWREARSAWSRCQAHRVGPEVDLLLDSKIDTFPVNAERVEAAISAAGPLDAAAVERLGGNAKGFFALELLLFAAPGEGDTPMRLASGDAAAARRRVMIVALASNLEQVAGQIRDLWEPERGGFARQFAEAGTRSSELATRDEAFDLLVNRMVSFSEWIADVHLVWPAGRNLDPVELHPEQVRARASANSIQDASDEIEGLRRLYLGSRDGSGLGALVAQASPELDASMRDAFTQASERVAAIPPPLDRALADAPEEVRLAYEAVKRLQVAIATDLVAVYQTTLRVVRFDGD